MENESENKVKNKHANGYGVILKIIIGFVMCLIILVISVVLWYNANLSGTGKSSEIVELDIELRFWGKQNCKCFKR